MGAVGHAEFIVFSLDKRFRHDTELLLQSQSISEYSGPRERFRPFTSRDDLAAADYHRNRPTGDP
jgi:hypothetical protein